MTRLFVFCLVLAFVRTSIAAPSVEIDSLNKDGDELVSVILSMDGIDGDYTVFAAYGRQAGSDITPSDWEEISIAGEVSTGDTSLVFDEIPSSWESTAFYMRFFLVSGHVGVDDFVEYIRSVDGASLDTGVYPSSYTTVRMRIRYESIDGGRFFGSYGNSDSDDWRYMGAWNTHILDLPPGGWRIQGSAIDPSTDYNIELGNIYIRDLDSGEYLANGNNFSSFDRRDYTLELFCDGSRGRMYYLDLLDADDDDEDHTIGYVREYRGAVKDGTVGMYDWLTGQFVSPAEGRSALERGTGRGVKPFTGMTASAYTASIVSEMASLPALGDTFTATETKGDTIVFSGKILNGPNTPLSVTVETSLLGDFSDAKEWTMTVEDLSFSGFLRDDDPSSPVYLPPSSTVYYRVTLEDALGETSLSPVSSFATSASFCSAPQLTGEAYAINGRLMIPLSGATTDYAFQRFNESSEWESVDSSSGVFTDGSTIRSTARNFTGTETWRVAYVPLVGQISLWTTVSIDARNPKQASELYYFGYTDGYFAAVANAFDAEPNSIYHAARNFTDDPDQDISIYIDFGAPRKISSFAIMTRPGYESNFGRVGNVALEIADDRAFTENVVTLYTVTDEERVGKWKKLWVFEIDNPVYSRYYRLRPTSGASMGDGWFNVAELELDEALDASNPAVAVADGDEYTGYATISFSSRFSPDCGVAVYRSKSATGGFALKTKLESGVTSWVDASAPFGKTVYYRLAKLDANGSPGALDDAVVSFTRMRRLVGADALVLNMPAAGSEAWYLSILTDGNINSFIDAYGSYSGGYWIYNPAFGYDFGEGESIHVAKCRFYPRNDGNGARMTGVAVFGSNDEAECNTARAASQTMQPDDGTPSVMTAFKAGSDMISAQFAVSEIKWHEYDCDSSAGYRYIYITHPTSEAPNGWCGNCAELEFYGWSESDLDNGGMIIVVR